MTGNFPTTPLLWLKWILISSKSKKSITLSDTYISTAGGVIVSNTDSTVIVNNTIEDRLERMKAELRTDVANKFK